MTAILGRVSELWRYPVSSFGGERLAEMAIGTEGADCDRMLGLVDAASGEPARPDANQQWHKVPLVKARLGDDRKVEIALPQAGWQPAPGEARDHELSEFLGFPVSLRPFSREAAPGFSGPLTSPRYAKAPVHVLTTASLARLKALHPAGNPDPRRFRPNVVVEMGAVEGSFPETEWIGRRLAIGEVELTISEPCRRCGFTILAQDDFANDPEILRSLVRHNARNIGVYCTVDRPGRVEPGAPMRFF